MVMTDREICLDYQNAKNRKNQIKILADLNGVKKKDIIVVLARYGIMDKPIEKTVAYNKTNAENLRLSRLKRMSIDELYALYKKHSDCLKSIDEVLEWKARNDMQ